MEPDPPFATPDVARAYGAFSGPVRTALLAVRGLVFEVAAETPAVGRIGETLKWGQPAYLTPETGAGSTLRLGTAKDGRPAVFVHCRTSIVASVAETFPDAFRWEGTRAARFDAAGLPEVPLRHLIRTALTYHQRS